MIETNLYVKYNDSNWFDGHVNNMYVYVRWIGYFQLIKVTAFVNEN